MSAPSLCSAFAIADSRAFLMMPAAFFCVNSSVFSARPTFLPRIRSATRRPLSADSRTPRTIALVSIVCSLALGLLVGRVTLEGPRQREFAELVADHLVGHVHGHVLLAVVHGDRQTDEVRQDRRAARPGLDGLLVLRGDGLFGLGQKVVVHEGTLLERACHGLALLLAARDDHRLRALVVARAIALGHRVPRRHRNLALAGAAFAAAVRVVHRVHRDTADGRADALPADRTGLAVLAQVVLFVGRLADGGAAVDVDLADFTRAQANLRIDAFARHQRDGRAGRTRDLRTLARLHFHAVDDRADRDVADGQRVAGLDRRFGAGQDRGTHFQAARSDDVAALAVGVADQRDVGGAVRVVLDGLDLGRDAVLVAHEVDDAVVVLVTTALVTDRDVAVVVAAGILLLRLEQRRLGLALVQVGVHDLHDGTAARRGRLEFDDGHLRSLPGEVELLTGLERHVRLLDVVAATDRTPETLDLALLDNGGDALDLDLEQQFDCCLDLGLGGVAQHLEQHLVVLLGDAGGLFRDDRGHQDRGEAVLVEFLGGAHANISLNCSIAALVTSTFL